MVGEDGVVDQGWGPTGAGGLSLWPLALRRLVQGKRWQGGLNGWLTADGNVYW